MAIPPSYVRARRKLAGREIALDWRKLGRRKARVWPGVLCLWGAREARRENAERGRFLDEKLQGRLFMIGTNTAGLLFAIDSRGRVVVFDEIEMDYPVLLATDFDRFERSFVVSTKKNKEFRNLEGRETPRRMSDRWRTLDAILEGRHSLSRTANVYGMLIDVANKYLLADGREALLDALRAFVKRHPSRKTLAAKLRKYANGWGAGRS